MCLTAQLWPFHVSPTLSLCLYFVFLTYLAMIWKSTFSFLCYFLDVLSQASGPVFHQQAEHTAIQAATGKDPSARDGTGAESG